MPLARCNLTIQDEFGNVVNGAEIEVRNEATGLLPQVYSDRDGLVALGNPYTAASGADAGFHAVGGEYKVTATFGGDDHVQRYVPCGLAAGTDFGGAGELEQEVTGSTATILDLATKVTVNRVAPSTTGLALPDASLRIGRPLAIADYSTSVTDHTITLTPFSVAQKIMRQSTWPMFSNASSLAGVTLNAIFDPDDSNNYVWIIAP